MIRNYAREGINRREFEFARAFDRGEFVEQSTTGSADQAQLACVVPEGSGQNAWLFEQVAVKAKRRDHVTSIMHERRKILCAAYPIETRIDAIFLWICRSGT